VLNCILRVLIPGSEVA